MLNLILILMVESKLLTYQQAQQVDLALRSQQIPSSFEDAYAHVSKIIRKVKSGKTV